MTTSVQPKDRMITANGLNIHYLDWGNEGRPVMVLLHGLRGHCHSWDDVSGRFCRDYQVLALDQRGRGESDWAPGGDYSTGAFVADLEGFSDALGLESFTLVGHSMGGRNSMAFAGNNPERLDKLIIVDVGPDLDPRGAARITREIQDVPEEFESFEAVFEYMNSQNRFASEPVLRRRLTYATRELPGGGVGWRYDLAIREQRRNNSVPPAPDLWPSLERITCPTLVVRGSETDTLDLGVAQRMVETLKDGRLTHVERAAHMVFEDNPEGFNQTLADFLA